MEKIKTKDIDPRRIEKNNLTTYLQDDENVQLYKDVGELFIYIIIYSLNRISQNKYILTIIIVYNIL